MAGHIGDWPEKTSGAVKEAMAKSSVGRTDSVRKADAAHSKGPAGIGLFGDFTPQDIRSASNPYGQAWTFDVIERGIGPVSGAARNNAARQARGVVPQQHSLPAMVGNIFKAFEDAEGRAPTDSDSEFFKAIVVAFDAHGEQVADEIGKAANGDAEPMSKASTDDLTERFSKTLDDNARRG